MSYFDDPLGGSNPWIPRQQVIHHTETVYVEDTASVEIWKNHAKDLKKRFLALVDDRDVVALQRDAWFETCVELRDRFAPHIKGSEVNAIYDEKEAKLYKERGINPETNEKENQHPPASEQSGHAPLNNAQEGGQKEKGGMFKAVKNFFTGSLESDMVRRD